MYTIVSMDTVYIVYTIPCHSIDDFYSAYLEKAWRCQGPVEVDFDGNDTIVNFLYTILRASE